MRFTEDPSSSKLGITAYGDGFVTLNGIVYRQSLLVFPDARVTGWDAASPEEIQPERVAVLFDANPEVVLLGTGPRLIIPPRATLIWLQSQRIGFEMMSTGALCRTYNLLTGEGRRVGAALLPP